MSRKLCLWFPDWPVQRMALARPELQGRPRAVHQLQPRGAITIVACSREARQLGIRRGMPLAEATALSARSRTGPPVLAEYDTQADRQALVELALELQKFSPQIGLTTDEPSEGLWADVTGIPPLFGGETPFLHLIAQHLAARRLQVRVALADFLGAAWAVAHFERRAASLGASDEIAIFLVATDETAAALHPLPIEALRLPVDSVEVLGRLGIESVGQLAALPRAGLQSRLGPACLRRLDQAMGTAAEVFVVLQPPPEFSATWTFDYPTDRRETIQFVLGQLVARVVAQLDERGYGALRVAGHFAREAAAPASLEVGLFRPSAEAKHLAELVEMQLESLRLSGLMAAITLQATHYAPLDFRQQELFSHGEDQQAGEGPELAMLIDRLAGRLGRAAIVRPRLRADAQPELAWREEPLVGVGKPRRQSPRQVTFAPLERPLLLDRAAKLRVETAPDGRPANVHCAGQWRRVARAWGPERIETGWWRKRGVRRDYYRIETDTGNRFWIYRRLGDGCWFWQGEF